LGAIETVRIVEELMEIWLNEVCDKTNLWHPVAFFSKSLDIHERNYKIYDKELLAVIWRLEEYRHYLEEHLHKIEIWLDH